jgi:hypothetical protein
LVDFGVILINDKVNAIVYSIRVKLIIVFLVFKKIGGKK